MEKVIELKKWYLSEFVHVDGYSEIVMNIVDICPIKQEIAIAITDQGKISVRKFDLKTEDEKLFFEFGIMREQIAITDFDQVEPDYCPF